MYPSTVNDDKTSNVWILSVLLLIPILYALSKMSNSTLMEKISTNWFGKMFLYFLIIAFTLVNNIGTQQMGYYMPAYISFTLYFTSIIYTVLFAITALIRKETFFNLSHEQYKYILICGILTGIGGIFSQVAVPYIAPEFSALFTNFQSPLTWIISFFLYKDRPFTVSHLFGTIIMTTGLLYGSIYSLQHGTGSTNANDNPTWAMILCLLSAVFAAILTIVQEHLYRNLKAPKFVSLTYYNLITIPMYGLWIFSSTNHKLGQCINTNVTVTECSNYFVACETSQLMSHESDAFKCFFGNYDVSCCGGVLATVWTSVFVIGYWLMFAMQALLLDGKSLGSDAVANSVAIGTPLSMCFFWWPQLVGVGFGYTEYKPWILISAICVGIGLLFYEIFGEKKWKFNTNLKCVQELKNINEVGKYEEIQDIDIYNNDQYTCI